MLHTVWLKHTFLVLLAVLDMHPYSEFAEAVDSLRYDEAPASSSRSHLFANAAVME